LQKRPTKFQRSTTQMWQIWFESLSTREDWMVWFNPCVSPFGRALLHCCRLFYKRELTICLERGTLNIWTPQGTRHTCTGWRRTTGCLKVHVNFRKRATNYRALLQKMTSKDKASFGSSPPCNTGTATIWRIPDVLRIFCKSTLHEYKRVLRQCDTHKLSHVIHIHAWRRTAHICNTVVAENRRLHRFRAHFSKRALQKMGKRPTKM